MKASHIIAVSKICPKALIMDCDGVLWTGDKCIPESIKALNKLGQARPDIKMYFLTNNSAKTRQQYSAKFESFGCYIPPSSIITSSSLAASIIKRKKIKRTLMLGNSGLRGELEAEGIEVVEIPDPQNPSLSEQDFDRIKLDPAVEAVVLGFDPNFTYKKIAIGSLYLRSMKIPYFVTNMDAVDRTHGGNFIPVTGSIAVSLEMASGVTPIVCGKPSLTAVEIIKSILQCPSNDDVVMVGDRLDTDIEFANVAGFRSCCVLTGCTTKDEAERELVRDNSIRKPTIVCESFGEFIDNYIL